jgi:tetratricopeptide (TPR) repeat protein
VNALVLALALMQGGADALSARALELASAGRAAEAEGLWRQAAELAPGHFASLFNLGFLAVRQGKDGEAADWLRRAATASPKDFNSFYLLGTVLSRRDETDEALRAWRRASALQPGNRKLMQVMSVEYSKGRYFEEAARMAEAALRLEPEDQTLYFLAMKARQDAGQHEEAYALARRALAKFPQSARANFEVGFHLHKLGRWDEALPYFDKAIAADAAYEEPYYFRGDVLLRREQAGLAEAEFRRALEKRGEYTVARLALGRALMAQGKMEQALAELREAARRDPVNPQPHLLLSQVLFRMGNAAEAKLAKETSQRLRLAQPEILNVPQARPFPVK